MSYIYIYFGVEHERSQIIQASSFYEHRQVIIDLWHICFGQRAYVLVVEQQSQARALIFHIYIPCGKGISNKPNWKNKALLSIALLYCKLLIFKGISI